MGVIFQNGFSVGTASQGYSFTITSSDITNGYGNFNSWNGHEYPTALGTNGVDGFNVTFYAGQPSYLEQAGNIPYVAQINNQTIIDFFNNLVTLGIFPYANYTTIWNVQWGAGSTHATGVVSLDGVGNINSNMLMAPLDTTDSTWNQPGNGTTVLEGDYYFPATFTLIEPVFNKGGWC